MQRFLVCALLLALGWAGNVHAQGIPVIDATNATINTKTSLETSISAVENVVQSAYMFLDLTPFDDVVISAQFIENIEILGAIVLEGQALLGDLDRATTQINALFGPGTVPRLPSELQRRIAETKALIHKVRVYAVRVQLLVKSIVSAMEHLQTMVELVGLLRGNMQGNQSMMQLMIIANQTAAQQAAQAAAAYQVHMLEQMQKAMVLESWNLIQAERWSDWPGVLGGGE